MLGFIFFEARITGFVVVLLTNSQVWYRQFDDRLKFKAGQNVKYLYSILHIFSVLIWKAGNIIDIYQCIF